MLSNPTKGITWLRTLVPVVLVVYWVTMFAATHAPKIPKGFEPRMSDKWQHYVAYCGLGFLLAATWSLRRPLSRMSGIVVFGAIAAYGAFDEITQPLVGRDAELLDWRSDVIGAATGIALYAMAAWFIARHQRANPSPQHEGSEQRP